MKIQIEMPQLSSEGESATLATWLIKAGDRVEAGEVIAELETDKSTVELEAPATGKVVEIQVPEGTENIAPGSILGSIDSEVASDSRPAEVVEAEAQAATAPTEAIDPRSSTPLARRAAAHRGLDLDAVPGSGPGGRIIEADVLRVAQAPVEEVESPSSVGTRVVRTEGGAGGPVTAASRTSERVVPYSLGLRCSMDAVMEARTRLNAELEGRADGVILSLNDFVVRAVALALRAVPDAHVGLVGDGVQLLDPVHLAVGIMTAQGSMTPVLRNADRKGLVRLAVEMKAFEQRAQEGELVPEECEGGTFTISNLGMYGIETVSPALSPGQICILGVGSAEQSPVVREGAVGVGWLAMLTLSADPRAIEGVVGAELLAAIRERLEDPLGMLL